MQSLIIMEIQKYISEIKYIINTRKLIREDH